MKKILTLFIALILVAGIVSVAKSTNYDVDPDVSGTWASTSWSNQRHVVQSSDGTIVVFYLSAKPGGGLVAKKSTKTSGGAAWTNLAGGAGYTVIDSNYSSIRGYSICIDDNDNIYMTYEYLNDIFFKKLTAVAGTWTTWTVPGSPQTVDATNDNAYSSITRQSNGRVWVSYGQDNGSSAWLRAMYSDNDFVSAGTLTTIDSGGIDAYLYPSALVLRNDSPYIVYNDDDLNDLRYAYWDGSWNSGLVNDIQPYGYKTDFSVTLITTTVHVVWVYNDTLRHTYSYNGTSWSSPLIVSTSEFEYYYDRHPSLTTDWDTDDVELWVYASIYYTDSSSSYNKYNIKYKKWSGSTWPGSWTAVSTNNLENTYPGTPFVSGAKIPVAWGYDDDPSYSPSDERVKFNYDKVTLDITPPEAPTGVNATPSGWTSTNSFNVDWTNPVPPDPSGIAGAYYKLDSVPTSNTNGTWKTNKPITNITVSGSGAHPIYIWLRDRAGNINYVNRSTTTLKLDTTAPTTPGTPSTPTPTSDTTPTWNWTASTDAHSGLRATNTYIIYWDTVAGGEANSAYTNTNSYTHTVELGYGTWYAKVRAYDAVDNPSLFSGNGSVLIESPSKTYTWDEGGAYGDWDDPLNWDLDDGYPNAASDKAIINTGSESINTGAARTIGELELGSSYSGTLTLGGALTLNDLGEWNGSLTISNANTTLDLIGYNLTIPGTFSNNGTLKLQGGQTLNFTNDTNSGTVEYVGDGDAAGDIYTLLDSGTTDYYNLTINSTDGATDTFRPYTTNLTVAYDFTLSSGTFTTNDGTTDRNLTVGGSVDIIGTFTANNSTITVSGNWDSYDGVFNYGTSTVDLVGTSTSTLTGSTTFYGLVSTASGKNVKVSSDTVVDVTGYLNFENITLRSTLNGATWYLNLSGTQDVSNVNVQDSNASGSTDTIIAFTSTDSGNNTKWDFGPPEAITDLTGECDSGTGDVTLSWSTPGDDYNWQNTLVDGSKYRIDYSSYSIAWSTSTFDLDISTSGVAPHTQVSRTITGLTADTTWYFRIWTADEVPLWSGLSNGATVWVNPILSVSISTDTYNFGTIDCGTSTVSSNIITVTNDSNVTETYSIKCSSTTKWTPEDTPGPNEFTLQSAFHSSEPADSDLVWKTDDILTESLQTCTTAVFSIDGTEHGKEVPPFNANTRKLWYRLKTPLSTSTTDQQNIIITISAEQSP